ncbi:MAG: cation-translocating P-type ATPase [Betaproteobacteria bacterium]|nr:cation-translocating P-type ATPase [Betaproteobacteria bacterium]
MTAARSAPSRETASVHWHCLSPEDVSLRLESSRDRGLPGAEAARRLARCGANEIREAERRGPWRMLLDQFTDFMIIVLMVAAVISGAIGEPQDAIAILVIVLLNAMIGFIQEYRAERAMVALKKLAAATARVLRDGAVSEVPAAALVPGDVVLLDAGGVVPADLRLLEAVALHTEEAALTGESTPVEKQVAALSDPELPVGDRRNMAYKGTVATYGRGRGVVVATGMQTELGKIAALLAQEPGVRTPLQRRLEQFGRRVAIAALAICAFVFAFGVLRGEPPVLMFLTAVSLAVAAIPEALPAVVTISLALGAYKMVRRNALIRRLPAVETLGSVTFICSDKTGTLTRNRMRVEEIHADGRPWREWDGGSARSESWRLLLQAMALNNDASVLEDGREIGDPTEVALLAVPAVHGLSKAGLESQMPRVAELPFDSERKCMTTLHRRDGGVIAFTKGAPERLVEKCVAVLNGAEQMPVQADVILAQAERMAHDGLRVIAFAFRVWPVVPAPLKPEQVEAGLVLLGLVGMIDPPRPEAREAVAVCKAAGITPVIVTGDHPATAKAIAARLGIMEEGTRVITGRELARLGAEEFAAQVRDIRVYARVDPAQKIRIVEALQSRGEFVAMTGDGVNDAPALKRAEIGIAMGRIGTDVAREASHVVLLDDNFATIVTAVREGRRIYDNIRKFVRFVMGGNTGEIVTILVAPLLGLPLPLLPIQILWVNLATDGLPGLALAVEREEPAVMRRAPRPPHESIFAHGIWQHILWVGLLMGALSIYTQWWAIERGSQHWQTMVFTVLALSQMYHVLAIRSERESTFAIGCFSNPALLGAVLLTFGLQLAIIYVPALQPIFKSGALSAEELAFSVLLPSLVFVGVEIEKWMIRKGWIYRAPGPAIQRGRAARCAAEPRRHD